MFLCVIVDGEIIFKEAEDAKWLDKKMNYIVLIGYQQIGLLLKG